LSECDCRQVCPVDSKNRQIRIGVGANELCAQFSPVIQRDINLVGGLAMGLLVGWLGLRAGAEQETVRVFAAVGLLGGFTTFSAFSLETVQMVEKLLVAREGSQPLEQFAFRTILTHP
jgi:fluoride ion exporter CrcB/FEX